ncbi:PEP/pyruvate-binding domain-containing protein [Streptomyces sp. CA-249302]|uniref:PEP/pyruvate-binding domain-containing protein n=1 Tax=Streptomyces sp. CA-249302 TaxID=3240058 RepID=UPI003D90E881
MTTLDERQGDGRIEARGPAGAYGPAAVPLDAPTAALPRRAGSKAANLARAARAGLPVLPGFVIPDGADDDTTALRRAWDELSEGGVLSLVVRSSSPQEDTQESSLAGQFASVLDVRGWRGFRSAVRAVRDSALRPDGVTVPMAVLVQPMLVARAGGVMFGADPVEGRADRMLVSAVRGGPESLVSGEQAGINYWLSRSGRLLRTEPADAEALLTRRELFRLARLARRARRVFGGPQDIEFGFDGGGRLWLFQSRPITAMAARPARGARLLGPGPVAETLPEQLLPLEEDLWVTPMARGLAAALDIGGSAPRRLLRRVPVVTTVGGRAAADLRLLGAAAPRHRWTALLNPAPGARRLGAAWRVGRLTAALPGLATDLVADVDHHLAGVPAPAELGAADLTAELRWTRTVLVSLHAQEALAGALLQDPPKSRTAAGAALSALAQARARGVPDERTVAEAPVVLALTAPSLRGRGRLPRGWWRLTGVTWGGRRCRGRLVAVAPGRRGRLSGRAGLRRAATGPGARKPPSGRAGLRRSEATGVRDRPSGRAGQLPSAVAGRLRCQARCQARCSSWPGQTYRTPATAPPPSPRVKPSGFGSVGCRSFRCGSFGRVRGGWGSAPSASGCCVGGSWAPYWRTGFRSPGIFMLVCRRVSPRRCRTRSGSRTGRWSPSGTGTPVVVGACPVGALSGRCGTGTGPGRRTPCLSYAPSTPPSPRSCPNSPA